MAQLPGDARVNQYTATAGQTTFTYDFKIKADDEIAVQKGSTTLTLTTHYTVTDAGEEAGGTIVLVTGAALNDIITLTGNSMVERETTFSNGGDFAAAAINGEYNNILNMLSENVTDIDKAVRLAVYDASFNTTIPTPVARKALMINTAGTGFEMSTSDPDEQTADAAASAAAALVSENAAAVSAAAALVSEGNAEQSAIDAAASAASVDFSTVAEDILPATDATHDLGSTTKSWAEVHCEVLAAQANCTVAGTLQVTGAITATAGIVGGAASDITLNTNMFTVDATNGNTVVAGTLTVGGAAVVTPKLAHYQHNVAYDVDGGGSTATAWTKRTLTTEVSDSIGIALNTSTLTIPAGTYKFSGYSVHVNAAIITIRLYSTTHGVVIATGATTNITSANEPVPIQGIFTLAGSTDVELQYYCTNALATTGLGARTNANVGNNVYADLIFEKVG